MNLTENIVPQGPEVVNAETPEARSAAAGEWARHMAEDSLHLTRKEMKEIQDGFLGDDQDEEDDTLFRLQQYDDAIEAERRQDAEIVRAERDYLGPRHHSECLTDYERNPSMGGRRL